MTSERRGPARERQRARAGPGAGARRGSYAEASGQRARKAGSTGRALARARARGFCERSEQKTRAPAAERRGGFNRGGMGSEQARRMRQAAR